MSEHPAGWYDDPQNPDNLRYWDGVTWTDHTSPKKSPTADQSTIGRPAAVPPAASQVPEPYQTGAPGQQGNNPYAGQQPAQQPGQYPPYQAYPGGTEQEWMTPNAMTPDGVPLASWGQRLGAWIIDGILITVLSLPFTYNLYVKTSEIMQRVFSETTPTQQQINDMQAEVMKYSLPVTIITFVIATLYCLFFWTRGSAQTPGKRVTGISVRLRDQPGPLTVKAALLRRVVPLAAMIVPFLSLLDGLWPLWDQKKQAIHDKVSKTNVVLGKQPPRL